MDVESVLQALFADGRAVDIAIMFIALEFAYLLWRAPQAQRGSFVVNLIFALGPGVCLMLALRCALTDAHVIWIAFWLAASLPLHVGDVMRRKL